jgi:hypothetical protein
LPDKDVPPVLKRKRNDSANMFQPQASFKAGADGDGAGLTQGTHSEGPRPMKRMRNDLVVTTDVCAEKPSDHGKDSPQRQVPVAVMVSSGDKIQNCSQDEWYGRLTPHGEDKRHELFFRYRERLSVESDSPSIA